MEMPHLKILKIISNKPVLTQRLISKEMSLSLGKINYMMRELIKKGYVKSERFKNSSNKLSYAYILTPKGMKKKVELTYDFLQYKSEEYERLTTEIKALEEDLNSYNMEGL
jgi:EPS-associated MarR family transcriptional regulator